MGFICYKEKLLWWVVNAEKIYKQKKVDLSGFKYIQEEEKEEGRRSLQYENSKYGKGCGKKEHGKE